MDLANRSQQRVNPERTSAQNLLPSIPTKLNSRRGVTTRNAIIDGGRTFKE